MKTEKIFWVLAILAAVAIVIFWIAEFCNRTDIATVAFFTAGSLGAVALGVKFIGWLRHRNLYGY